MTRQGDPTLPPDAGNTPETEALDHGILHEFLGMYLRVAYEVAYEDFARRLGEDALRPGYFTILTLVVRNPRISQTQIGIASNRDKSSITKALRWMEDEGLITRERSDQDRRAHLSVATPKGTEMQAAMERRAVAHVDAINGAIGADRRAEFLQMLKELIRNLQEPGAQSGA